MKHLLNDITTALLYLADREVKYQLKINDEIVSFKGVRLFKNVGAAKAQLTKRCEQILTSASYYSTPTWEQLNDDIKASFKRINESELTTSDKAENEFQIKKEAKEMCKTLLESGIAVIEEI